MRTNKHLMLNMLLVLPLCRCERESGEWLKIYHCKFLLGCYLAGSLLLSTVSCLENLKNMFNHIGRDWTAGWELSERVKEWKSEKPARSDAKKCFLLTSHKSQLGMCLFSVSQWEGIPMIEKWHKLFMSSNWARNESIPALEQIYNLEMNATDAQIQFNSLFHWFKVDANLQFKTCLPPDIECNPVGIKYLILNINIKMLDMRHSY